jgi:hypothetical protein
MISSLGAIFITDGLLAKQALALGQCPNGNPGERGQSSNFRVLNGRFTGVSRRGSVGLIQQLSTRSGLSLAQLS